MTEYMDIDVKNNPISNNVNNDINESKFSILFNFIFLISIFCLIFVYFKDFFLDILEKTNKYLFKDKKYFDMNTVILFSLLIFYTIYLFFNTNYLNNLYIFVLIIYIIFYIIIKDNTIVYILYITLLTIIALNALVVLFNIIYFADKLLWLKIIISIIYIGIIIWLVINNHNILIKTS